MSGAENAVRLGLLRFPEPGAAFPGRIPGSRKAYVIDTRGAGMHLELRTLVVQKLREQAARLPDFDVVAGIAKSGTVWAAWMAWEQTIPFANVLLDGPRTSGLQREVEGDIQDQRVLLIDNWVRSGSSIRKAAEVVCRAGGIPVAALAVVRNSNFDLNLPVASAWEISELLEAAPCQGLWNGAVPIQISSSPRNGGIA